MTLVAIAPVENGIDVVTDSMAYLPDLLEVDFDANKATILQRQATVLASQGPAPFGDQTKWALADAVKLSNVDDVAQACQVVLPLLWEHLGGSEMAAAGGDATIFVTGWSPQRRRFCSYAYCSEDGFEQVDLTHHSFFSTPAHHPGRLPTTKGEWVDVVDDIYEQCALVPINENMKRPLGGKVIRTQLRPGSITQQKIGRLPTDGPRFREMVIGTLHPAGQLGPCVCGSATPYVLCHLGRFVNGPAGKPCRCGSDRIFEDCHLVDTRGPEAKRHWREFRGDFERTAPALREAWGRSARREQPPAPLPVA